MFQVSKALRGDMDSMDLALFALFLTGVVLGVSRARATGTHPQAGSIRPPVETT
jgi:hypothetical protein